MFIFSLLLVFCFAFAPVAKASSYPFPTIDWGDTLDVPPSTPYHPVSSFSPTFVPVLSSDFSSKALPDNLPTLTQSQYRIYAYNSSLGANSFITTDGTLQDYAPDFVNKNATATQFQVPNQPVRDSALALFGSSEYFLYDVRLNFSGNVPSSLVSSIRSVYYALRPSYQANSSSPASPVSVPVSITLNYGGFQHVINTDSESLYNSSFDSSVVVPTSYNSVRIIIKYNMKATNANTVLRQNFSSSYTFIPSFYEDPAVAPVVDAVEQQTNSIGGFFQNLLSGITGLFIPSADTLQNYVASKVSDWETKGLASFPYTFTLRLLTLLSSDYSSVDPTISIPDFNMDIAGSTYKVFPAFEWHMSDMPDFLITLLRTVGDATLTLALIRFLINIAGKLNHKEYSAGVEEL